jgi:hypothetical protein
LTRKQISTLAPAISCDVCGRTLLRGENPDVFLHQGARRMVCELCTARAAHEGWIREGLDDATVRDGRSGRRGGRGLLGRLRARREPAGTEPPRDVRDEPAAAPEPVAETYAPETRTVHAVPTNADLKMQRALEIFNASDHTRTVGGVARSLGAPAVCVRPRTDRPSVVTITVMWELSWYRFEIDLSDEAGGVRRDAQGDELAELSDEEQVVNAAANERGALHLR